MHLSAEDKMPGQYVERTIEDLVVRLFDRELSGDAHQGPRRTR